MTGLCVGIQWLSTNGLRSVGLAVSFDQLEVQGKHRKRMLYKHFDNKVCQLRLNEYAIYFVCL